ncbi:reverse transcriptase domain-containing protein [Tanacetum coccineum]
MVKALQKPVITGVILGLLLLYDHHYSRLALAAPGGSMGWSSFSDSSSSSSDDEDSQSYRTQLEDKTPKASVKKKVTLKLQSLTFKCRVKIDGIRSRKGWNFPGCGGEKCKKGVVRKDESFWCQACEKAVDYPVLR